MQEHCFSVIRNAGTDRAGGTHIDVGFGILQYICLLRHAPAGHEQTKQTSYRGTPQDRILLPASQRSPVERLNR
jgi:hypothetical protein